MHAAYAIHEEQIARATAGDPAAYQEAMDAFEDALVEPLPQPAKVRVGPAPVKVSPEREKWLRERMAAVAAMGGEVG